MYAARIIQPKALLGLVNTEGSIYKTFEGVMSQTPDTADCHQLLSFLASETSLSDLKHAPNGHLTYKPNMTDIKANTAVVTWDKADDVTSVIYIALQWDEWHGET